MGRVLSQNHLVAKVNGAKSTKKILWPISSNSYPDSKATVHQSATFIAQEALFFKKVEVFLFETRFIRILVAQDAQKRRQMNLLEHFEYN
ncbi:hypothetical protein NPIL_104951 [Nephila pilipes]|uniref:Uncharacterized protein n=1 Tax=Nephila pilipes TaxID=299642 RepID=A0A8X6N5D5_NEPPI|nr:hypothetical protein NPIL_104951 [Nephila pilipes]